MKQFHKILSSVREVYSKQDYTVQTTVFSFLFLVYYINMHINIRLVTARHIFSAASRRISCLYPMPKISFPFVLGNAQSFHHEISSLEMPLGKITSIPEKLTLSKMLTQWFLTRIILLPRGHLAMSEDICDFQDWRGLLPASSGQKPQMLLNNRLYTGKHTPHPFLQKL